MSCLFSVQDIAELGEVVFYQRGVSREVYFLHTVVAVMVKTGDG